MALLRDMENHHLSGKCYSDSKPYMFVQLLLSLVLFTFFFVRDANVIPFSCDVTHVSDQFSHYKSDTIFPIAFVCLIFVCIFLSDRRDWLVSTPALYSGGSGFTYWPGGRLLFLGFVAVVLSLSMQMLSLHLEFDVRALPCTSFSRQLK